MERLFAGAHIRYRTVVRGKMRTATGVIVRVLSRGRLTIRSSLGSDGQISKADVVWRSHYGDNRNDD